MSQSLPGKKKAEANQLRSVLQRNIEALRERRKRATATASREERLADSITQFTGSMRFVYIHLAIYGFWIIYNLLPAVPHFDPTFVVLAMVASVEAIFLSTFVLISQNRAKAAADKRDDLDLQINLLAEHELTQMAVMLAAIAKKLQVESDTVSGIEDVAKDVAPEAVLDAIELRDRT